MAADEGGRAGVRTMKASEFKAKCLKLMDEVAETGEEIVITKNRRPVAKLTPLKQRPKTLFGVDRGRIKRFWATSASPIAGGVGHGPRTGYPLLP